MASKYMSARISQVAQHKASLESSRPEQQLRLLLAHVRILDIIEQNEAALYENEAPTKSPSKTRAPEYERKRPCKPSRESLVIEKEAFDLLFEYIVPSSDDSPPSSPEESEFEEWYA